MQTVWEFSIGENDFRLSFIEEWREDTGAHLLRKRGTMFDPALLHWRQLQARLKVR
jgi:hypothetical protein